MLHKDFCLFNLWWKNLWSYHWAEWNFWPKLLSDGKGDCSLTGTWWTSQKESSTGHFFRLDEINCNTSGLSGEDLSDHTLGYFRCVTILLETESLDVGMGWYSLGFGGWSDFFDLVLRYALLWVEWPFCDEKWMYEKILNIFKNQNVSIILPLLYFSIF